MKTNLIFDEYGDATLLIPDEFLAHLGWKEGDELIIDIPSHHPDQIVIHKKEPHGA